MKKRQEKLDTEELTCKLYTLTHVLKEMKVDTITRKVIAKNETKGKRRGRAPAKLSSLRAYLGLNEEIWRVRTDQDAPIALIYQTYQTIWKKKLNKNNVENDINSLLPQISLLTHSKFNRKSIKFISKSLSHSHFHTLTYTHSY